MTGTTTATAAVRTKVEMRETTEGDTVVEGRNKHRHGNGSGHGERHVERGKTVQRKGKTRRNTRLNPDGIGPGCMVDGTSNWEQHDEDEVPDFFNGG